MATEVEAEEDVDQRLGEFIILLKNVRSLVSHERLVELAAELDSTRWDVALVNET